jgi:predicted small integral membrane protein
MLITRLTKIAMCLALAGFCLIVTFDNITDPHSNYRFVQHVMSMDTTFPDNRLMYRAVTTPFAWEIVYSLIIATEAACGVLFLAGAVRMWRARRAPGVDFNSAKAYAIGGALLAFMLWFFVFMVIAGEWFAMWQSKTWNGQAAAFRFYVTVLAVLIFVSQHDGDLPEGPRHDRSPSHRDLA